MMFKIDPLNDSAVVSHMFGYDVEKADSSMCDVVYKAENPRHALEMVELLNQTYERGYQTGIERMRNDLCRLLGAKRH